MCAFDFKMWRRSLACFVLAAGLGIAQPARNTGCVSCHGMTDSPTMHTTGTVFVGCVDCHGGNAEIQRPSNTTSAAYEQAKKRAHPQPRVLSNANSANPVRAYTDWLKERWEYIRLT